MKSGFVVVAIVLLIGLQPDPVFSATCGVAAVTVKPGTGGFSNQIEFSKPAMGIIFQWKLGSDKKSYEMELETTTLTNDWVAIGFCLDNDFAQSKSCMDNCDFAILWKQKDTTKPPLLADCHLPKSGTPEKFSCTEGQNFKLLSSTASDTKFHATFTRKFVTGDGDLNDKKFDGQKYFLIGGSGTLDVKDDTGILKLDNGIKHHTQCSKSSIKIFETKSSSGDTLRRGTPVLIVVLVVFFGI